MSLYRCVNSKGVEGLFELNKGDKVESRFRARWKGSIIFVKGDREHAIAYVRQEIDRHGNPIRKPKDVRLNTSWLRRI